MKIFEIFGLSRSGHHAMTNWLIKNMCGDECAMDWKLNIMNNGLFYINEGNLDEELTLKYIEEQKNNIRVLIISYENCDLDYSILNDNKKYISPLSINNKNVQNFSQNYRIVFIRDFFNNLASRVVSNEKKMASDRDGNNINWDLTNNFVIQWKESAKHILTNKCLHLKYEDWLISQKKRSKFIKKILGHGEMYDNKVKGTHSSFGDGNTLDRFSEINLNENIKKEIRKDSELHYLMGGMGYNFKKI